MTDAEYLPWSAAMERALYGADGFYRARGGPAAHFRTSVHASPLFATAIARLLRETDEALGRPRELTLVDVGAGRAELLQAVRAHLIAEHVEVPARAEEAVQTEADAHEPLIERLRLVAVELAERPDDLTTAIEWRNELPTAGSVTGLLVANEWLDNVPCDVVQAAPGSSGWRGVEVKADGTERLGAAPDREQAAWLSAWWPIDGSSDISSSASAPDTFHRAEIGLSRDAAWRQAVATIARGVAIAIDYAHTRSSRPPFGTMTGYAHGRQTVPVPDGSCDITAHVALDSCAAAAAAHAEWTVQASQRAVLHTLGITGARPDLSLASRDPRGYLQALSQASAAAELTDIDGLGGFGWLVQGIGVPVMPALAPLTHGA